MDFALDWPESIALIFFILGLIFAFFADSFLALFLVSFLMGLFFGRVLHRQKESSKVPLAFTVLLFLLGMFVGSFFAWVRWVTLLLAIGLLISYWLHESGLVDSV